MQIGDLVKHKYGTYSGHGMVIELPNDSLCHAVVLWMTGLTHTVSVGWLEAI